MPDIYEYEFRVIPQQKYQGYSNLTHRIEAREILNGRSQDQFWAVWSVDRASLRNLLRAIQKFLVENPDAGA